MSPPTSCAAASSAECACQCLPPLVPTHHHASSIITALDAASSRQCQMYAHLALHSYNDVPYYGLSLEHRRAVGALVGADICDGIWMITQPSPWMCDKSELQTITLFTLAVSSFLNSYHF